MPRRHVVTVTGGSGGAILLEGLRNHDIELSAICTTFDRGGSTGRILKEFGNVLPAGDLRRCLWALAEPGFLRDLFAHRLEGNGTQLSDHSIGNILLLAAERMCGDPVAATRQISKVLQIRGEVFPVSTGYAQLTATLSDKSRVVGEDAIGTRTREDRDDMRTIVRVQLDRQTDVLFQAAEALRQADLIVIGPGDLYTSILPNFLVRGVGEAIRTSKAQIVFVTNLMTRAAETRGFMAVDFARTVLEYNIGRPILDTVLVNDADIPAVLAETYYQSERAEPVSPSKNLEQWAALAREVRWGNFLSKEGTDHGVVRHDPTTLAQAVMGCFSP